MIMNNVMLTTCLPFRPYTTLTSQPVRSVSTPLLSTNKPEFGSHIAKGVQASNLLTFLQKNGFNLGTANSSHTSVVHPQLAGSNASYTVTGHQNTVHINDWKHTMDCLQQLGCDLDETALKRAVAKKRKL